MTCVVGLVGRDKKIYMGADSAGVGGWSLRVRKDEKVFRNGSFLFGFTSSFRMGQLLRYSFSPPEHPGEWSNMKYMVDAFIPAVRECLKKGGFIRKENEVENGGVFLVGYKDQLFEIQSDFQVAQYSVPYAAVGCGEDYALGAMKTVCDMREFTGIEFCTDEFIVRNALSVAESFSAGVRGPFVIESMEIIRS